MTPGNNIEDRKMLQAQREAAEAQVSTLSATSQAPVRATEILNPSGMMTRSKTKPRAPVQVLAKDKSKTQAPVQAPVPISRSVPAKDNRRAQSPVQLTAPYSQPHYAKDKTQAPPPIKRELSAPNQSPYPDNAQGKIRGKIQAPGQMSLLKPSVLARANSTTQSPVQLTPPYSPSQYAKGKTQAPGPTRQKLSAPNLSPYSDNAQGNIRGKIQTPGQMSLLRPSLLARANSRAQSPVQLTPQYSPSHYAKGKTQAPVPTKRKLSASNLSPYSDNAQGRIREKIQAPGHMSLPSPSVLARANSRAQSPVQLTAPCSAPYTTKGKTQVSLPTGRKLPVPNTPSVLTQAQGESQAPVPFLFPRRLLSRLLIVPSIYKGEVEDPVQAMIPYHTLVPTGPHPAARFAGRFELIEDTGDPSFFSGVQTKITWHDRYEIAILPNNTMAINFAFPARYIYQTWVVHFFEMLTEEAIKKHKVSATIVIDELVITARLPKDSKWSLAPLNEIHLFILCHKIRDDNIMVVECTDSDFPEVKVKLGYKRL